ncbi:MAG: DUF3392 domain-containing protein [Gemmatimonadota bacterium]
MEYATQFLAAANTWVGAHLSAISAAVTTTLLVVFGDDINRFVKNRIRGHNFLVRTAVFVALCAFGYGLLSVLLTPSVGALLTYFGSQYLAPVTLAAFVAMGLLAERKRYL